MDIEEVQKAVAGFEAKLKPVTPQMKAMAAGAEVKEEIPAEILTPVPAGVVEEGGPCVTKDFKKVVGALPHDYIGKDGTDIKDLVIEFLQSLPECEE